MLPFRFEVVVGFRHEIIICKEIQSEITINALNCVFVFPREERLVFSGDVCVRLL